MPFLIDRGFAKVKIQNKNIQALTLEPYGMFDKFKLTGTH